MSSSSSETEENEEQWEVKTILKDRRSGGVHEYYVKWKDQLNKDGTVKVKYSLDDWDEWLTEENLNCPDLVKKYNERKAKEREERSKKKQRASSSEMTSKKDKTPRRDGKSSKYRGDKDEETPRSSGKKKNKQIVESDEDNDEAYDQPCSSSSLRPPVSSRSSYNPPSSSSSPAPQISSKSNLKTKKAVGVPIAFSEETPRSRSHMDSNMESQKLRKENNKKDTKHAPAKTMKRKGKPISSLDYIRVSKSLVEGEPTNEDMQLFRPLPKCFKKVKSKQLDRTDKSSSEESGSEESNEDSEDERNNDSVEKQIDEGADEEHSEVLSRKCEEQRSKPLEKDTDRLIKEVDRYRIQVEEQEATISELRRRAELAEQDRNRMEEMMKEEKEQWEQRIRSLQRKHEEDMDKQKKRYAQLEGKMQDSETAVNSVKTAMEVMRASLEAQFNMMRRRIGDDIEITRHTSSPSPIDRKRKK